MSKALAAAFEASVAAKGDLPVTAGMARWNQAGRPKFEWAYDRVLEEMVKDIGGRSDGSGRIRPSSIGHACNRYKLLSYLGYDKLEPTVESESFMDTGTWAHYRWQFWGLCGGWLKDIEVKVANPAWAMAGAMDGVIVVDDSPWEFKQTGTHIYNPIIKNNSPKWEHLMQFGAYLQASGNDKGSIVYEDRGTPHRWHEFRVSMSKELEFALGLLRRDVVRSIKGHELPAMLDECRPHEGARFEGCEFREVCPTAKWRTLPAKVVIEG